MVPRENVDLVEIRVLLAKLDHLDPMEVLVKLVRLDQKETKALKVQEDLL